MRLGRSPEAELSCTNPDRYLAFRVKNLLESNRPLWDPDHPDYVRVQAQEPNSLVFRSRRKWSILIAATFLSSLVLAVGADLNLNKILSSVPESLAPIPAPSRVKPLNSLSVLADAPGYFEVSADSTQVLIDWRLSPQTTPLPYIK